MVLLYYLSQNPRFTESVKPIMDKLKDSEQMLDFLKELSQFSKTFGVGTPQSPSQNAAEPQQPPREEASPTKGIADEFIQNILDGYWKKRD